MVRLIVDSTALNLASALLPSPLLSPCTTLPILILGASTRAAAYSAYRAGLEPSCIDLFADADLTALAPTRQVARVDYPHALADLAAEAAPGPWFYTGALENHPGLVDRIARSRPLWGNPGHVLRAVRDPFAWASTLNRAGLPCPAVRSSPDGLARDRTWLLKPLASAGGHGIVSLGPETVPPARPVFYQQQIVGLSLSAIFVGRPHGASLAGVTRQWLGQPGNSFSYVGSVGPWPLAPIETVRIQNLGDHLCQAFGLRGLFGVDFVLRDGQPWPVEINPRYTASVEVLELALGVSLLAAHRAVFDPTASIAPPFRRPGPPRPATTVAKLILFATAPCSFPDTSRPRPLNPVDRFAIPKLADRPQPGTRFEPGEPIATLFEQASAPEECIARIQRRRMRWERHLR